MGMPARNRVMKLATWCLAPMLVMTASPAMAYLGPGLGLSAIGSVLSFLGVLFLMLVGFIWYPLKRQIAKMQSKKQSVEEQDG